MKKKGLYLLLAGLLSSMGCQAQDTYLKELVAGVKELRKATKETRNKAVLNLSATGKPKITLMDELKKHENEYRGKDSNTFMMNQIVTYVYSRQNTVMVSKGDFFNSTETDIYYSVIEKKVKKGLSVTYSITGHAGNQEFMFVPFHSNAKYEVYVSATHIEPKKGISKNDGIQYVNLGKVTKQDSITFTIKSSANESFVILNYNPQK